MPTEDKRALVQTLETIMRSPRPDNMPATHKGWEIYSEYLCRGAVPEEGFLKTVVRELTGRRDDTAQLNLGVYTELAKDIAIHSLYDQFFKPQPHATGNQDEPDTSALTPCPEAACALMYYLAHNMRFHPKGWDVRNKLRFWTDRETGHHLLHWCVTNSHHDPAAYREAIWCLIELIDVDTDWSWVGGFTPLHLAAKLNHWECAEAFFQLTESRTTWDPSKSDYITLYPTFKMHAKPLAVDATDCWRHTPFHWAVMKGHMVFAMHLVERGADPKKACKRAHWTCKFPFGYTWRHSPEEIDERLGKYETIADYCRFFMDWNRYKEMGGTDKKGFMERCAELEWSLLNDMESENEKRG